jgi:TetR/AcrR family transcriptional regulator, fatty acid metabolism regulator protein
LAERSKAQEGKRRIILDAAVEVFARRGYHASRVGDIAREAGVAHGLLYHYFESKAEVLNTVFRENWAVLVERLRVVAASDEPAGEKLSGIAKVLLRSWLHSRSLTTVMILEIARSPQLREQDEQIEPVFEVIRTVMVQGIADGEFRPDLDPLLAAWIFYGALEEILTGWVLAKLPGDEADVARAEESVIAIVRGGLTR